MEEEQEEIIEFIPPYTTKDFNEYLFLKNNNIRLFRIPCCGLDKFPIQTEEFMNKLSDCLKDDSVSGTLEPNEKREVYINSKTDRWEEMGDSEPNIHIVVENFSSEPIDISKGWITKISAGTKFISLLEVGHADRVENANEKLKRTGIKDILLSDSGSDIYTFFDKEDNRFEISYSSGRYQNQVDYMSISYMRVNGNSSFHQKAEEQREEFEDLEKKISEEKESENTYVEFNKIVQKQNKYIGTETLTEGIKEDFIKRIKEDYTPNFKDRALTLRPVYENWHDSGVLYDVSYYNSYDIVRYKENGGKEYIYTNWNKAINEDGVEVELNNKIWNDRSIVNDFMNIVFFDIKNNIIEDSLEINFIGDIRNQSFWNGDFFINVIAKWDYKDGRHVEMKTNFQKRDNELAKDYYVYSPQETFINEDGNERDVVIIAGLLKYYEAKVQGEEALQAFYKKLDDIPETVKTYFTIH